MIQLECRWSKGNSARPLRERNGRHPHIQARYKRTKAVSAASMVALPAPGGADGLRSTGGLGSGLGAGACGRGSFVRALGLLGLAGTLEARFRVIARGPLARRCVTAHEAVEAFAEDLTQLVLN